MPGLCLAGENPEIQGFSRLQKTLSGILGQKVVQQPQRTTTSLEKPATKRESGETEDNGRVQERTNKYRKKEREKTQIQSGGEMEWKKGVEKNLKKKKKKKEERRAAASSSWATEQQGQSIKRVHPVIMSPLKASQPGAPCNCVSHQPAITFKGAALEASVIRNPGWPRPGLRHQYFSPTNQEFLHSSLRSRQKSSSVFT